MPSSLLHFLAEWRRARRVVRINSLDVETLLELANVVTGSGEVGLDGPLATTFAIGCWELDPTESESVKQWFVQSGLGAASDEVDTNDGTDLLQYSTMSADAHESAPTDKRVFRRTLPPRLARRGSMSRGLNLDPEASTFSTNSVASANSGRAYAFLMKAKEAKDARHLLFRNPTHPLSVFPPECTKEEFVDKIRKFMSAEEMFSEGVGKDNSHPDTPLTTVHEAEDLFDALMITQAVTCQNTGSKLQTGLMMDRMVRRCEILSIFRQLIERDQATINSFLQTYFIARKQDSIDTEELRHFFRGSIDSYDFKIDEVLAALDESGDERIDIQEFQLMMGLVGPPRPNIIEFICQLELKHGYGRSGMSCQSLTRSALYQHMATVEKLILPPEDVVTLYRAACGPKIPQEMPLEYLSAFLKTPPIGLSWGVEVHMVNTFYDALGCRALAIERVRNKEAPLPPEAILDSTIPNAAAVESRFQELWERYGKPYLSSVSSNSELVLEEGCFEKFKAEVAAVAKARAKVEADSKRSAARLAAGYRSLFTNIGDVLATGSTRLLAGQTCVVRYRLQGACSFWGPGHTVLKDEREPITWPPQRKMLGETAFIALVPRGLSWVSAGGGGFYNGNNPFSSVDPNLRAELPRAHDGAQYALTGVVEISMPSLARSSRGAGGKAASRIQQFDLRLFCSTKNRIVGVLGDPVPITVIQQVPPPPCESLQLRCEGRNITLRWAPLYLGSLPKESEPELLRLIIKSPSYEETKTLEPDVTELELCHMEVDTEYEFRARYENAAGSSADAVAVCRTNALCPAPTGLTCDAVATAHVQLRWSKPTFIGNEKTKDAYQVKPEKIQSYTCMLKIVSEDTAADENGSPDLRKSRNRGRLTVVNTRPCTWTSKQVQEKSLGLSVVLLTGLRPDTRYCLADFRANNTMGLGNTHPDMEFWTIPLTPRIAHIRIRHGQVLLMLSEIGGLCLKHYEISIWRAGQREEKANHWTVQFDQLKGAESGGHELPLNFSEMPSGDDTGKHKVRIRARNAGGYSEWSDVHSSPAIARQQGADLAQAALVAAIKTPVIETLEQVLQNSKGIEFEDNCYVEEATVLLQRLKEVRKNLQEAVKYRHPEMLRQALQRAREETLPNLQKPEALLKKLDRIMDGLESAKGIEKLRLSIKAAEQAKLPTDLINPYRDRLKEREDAQKGLEAAMEAAKVKGLQDALKQAEGMDLPSETEAQEKLVQLEQTQAFLVKSMQTKVIPDLSGALTAVAKSGLKEPELTKKAREMLGTLLGRREHVQKELEKATDYRHPGKLKRIIISARLAQVSLERISNSDAIRKRADELIAKNTAAVGLQQREEALKEGWGFKIPAELMDQFQDQFEKLASLHKALTHGDPEVLRKSIQDCDFVGIKHEELLEARVVYRDWGAAMLRVETETSVQRMEPLRNALEVASSVGINEQVLGFAAQALRSMELRVTAEDNLREAVKHRKLEDLVDSLIAACNANAYDLELVQEANDMHQALIAKRIDLATAVEYAELSYLHRCLERVHSPPGLPPEETQVAENLLHQLRECEFWQLTTLLEHAEVWSKKAEESHTIEIEQNIMKTRQSGSASKPSSKTIDIAASHTLPLTAVRGHVDLLFEPPGLHIFTLPRELVECTIEVAMHTGPAEEMEAREQHAVRQTYIVLNALDKLVGSGDAVRALSDMPDRVTGEKGRRHRRRSVGDVSGRMELPVVIYMRDAHRSLDLADAMCRRRCLGLDLFPKNDLQQKNHAVPTPAGIMSSLSDSFTSSVVASAVSRIPAEEAPPRLADHVKSVRARIFRTLTIEFTWKYPKGIFDGMDCSCIVFDDESFVDIVDCRGTHGQKYGAPRSMLQTTGNVGKIVERSSINNAVRHAGALLNSEQRQGKQVMEVRFDILPGNITDLVFMLSPSNSQDLSRFASMKVSLFDTEAMDLLASHDIDNLDSSDCEAALTTVFARRDGLWHVHRLARETSGSFRDYGPVLHKLSQIGFPRNPAMRNLAQPVLSCMQTELGLAMEVKRTHLQTMASNSLRLGYAIEVHEGMEEPDVLIRRVLHPRITKAILQTLKSASGMSFGEKHLIMEHPTSISLRDLTFELNWEFPPVQDERGDEATFENINYYMDGACAVFEGQALRELVDYRGAHGVRWVSNGVLDYRGLWVGQIPVGDATGGSVQYGEYDIDNAKRKGKTTINVHFDRMPNGVSDFYLILTSHTVKAKDFSSVTMSVRDQHYLGHEVAALPTQSTTSSSASGFIMCRVHRSSSNPLVWSLDMSGSVCSGNATDYRAALELLWTAQAAERQEKALQWPNRTLTNDEKESKERPMLRLPVIDSGVFASHGLNRRLSGQPLDADLKRRKSVQVQRPQDALLGARPASARGAPRDDLPGVRPASAPGAPRDDAAAGGDVDAGAMLGESSFGQRDPKAREFQDAGDSLPPLETIDSTGHRIESARRGGRTTRID
eukprot:TRINITY_DN20403_c0_g1_i2.p1 TRINITY_DN20403_c0_g1~~TRINITY_DN20403_c0_g1_i2.p1  ORF type:complete len:2461 (-),score=358.89 TRINITY_DN20403_c0_g1_i2:579-7961(-)